jgi:Zn finger protein HypA/HybF involved in hydrogenase expression
MWTCRNCNVTFDFDQAEPEVDEQGYFFLCPACDYRNKLVDAGRDATGRPKLVQSDDE